jgi:hypothetical protein
MPSLKPRTPRWIQILKSLPDPAPPGTNKTTLGGVLKSDARLATVITMGILSQAAVKTAILTLLLQREPTKAIEHPRWLKLNFGKGGPSFRIELDDAGAGDNQGDAGDEATAGTLVDVEPPPASDDTEVTAAGVLDVMSAVANDLADTISQEAQAVGQVVQNVDMGELYDELYGFVMENL